MREIQGLKWVRVLDGRPEGLPESRPRGAKAKGVAFESAVAQAEGFVRARHGIWLEYADANGGGFAQPDFVFVQDGGLIVAEVKLTWRVEAYRQLRGLYWPLLRLLAGVPIGGIVVCRGLTQETPKGHVVDDLTTALALARSEPGVVPVLHLPFVGESRRSSRRGRSPSAKHPAWWAQGEAN